MAREQFQTLTEPMYYILIALSGRNAVEVDIMEKGCKKFTGRKKLKLVRERCIQCCLNLRKIRLFSGQKKKEEESLM